MSVILWIIGMMFAAYLAWVIGHASQGLTSISLMLVALATSATILCVAVETWEWRKWKRSNQRTTIWLRKEK